MDEKRKLSLKYLTFSLVLITVALFFAPVFLPFSKKARAEGFIFTAELMPYNEKNDNLGKLFTFDNSPKIDFVDNDDYRFTYKFKPTGGLTYRYLLGNNDTGFFKTYNGSGVLTSSYFAYIFTINRHDNGSSKGTPVKQVALIYDFCPTNSNGVFLRRTTASVSINGTVSDTFKLSIDNKDTLLDKNYCKKTLALNDSVFTLKGLGNYERAFISAYNWKIDEIGIVSKDYRGFETGNEIDVAFTVPSASVSYSLDFMTQFVGVNDSKSNFFYTEYVTKRSYASTKDGVDGGMSVYQNIKKHYDADTLKTAFEGYNEDASKISATSPYAKAKNILDSQTQVKKKVRYLKEIDGTPFAAPVEKIVTVSSLADTNKALHDEICSALGITNFRALDSWENADEPFTSLETVSGVELIKVNYLKAKWLRSFDHNGNYVDYFLGLESYYDYYHKFIRDESDSSTADVFDKGLYEVYLNSFILTKYPQVAGYTAKEIYGYFGFVAIPQAVSLNSVLDYFFDTKTSKCNVLNLFSYKDTLTKEAYDKLLTDYKYTWLKKAFYNATNLISGSTENVQYYMFYSDKGANQSIIGENGSEDPDNDKGKSDEIIKETVNEVVSDIDQTKTFVKGAAQGIWSILGNVIDGFNGFFGNGVVKTVLPLVVLVGLGLFLYLKFFAGGFSRKKSNSKRGKKK